MTDAHGRRGRGSGSTRPTCSAGSAVRGPGRRPSRSLASAAARKAGGDGRLVERVGQVDSPAACARRTSVGGRQTDRLLGRCRQRAARARRGRPPSPGRARGSGPSARARSGRARRTGWPSRPAPARRGAPRPTPVPAGSSWAVGSSRTRTVVPIATMLAMATRCCSPPDRANGSRSARWPIASRASVASIRASISSRGTPRFSSPKASSSRTVSFDADSWLAGVAKTIPTRPSSAPAAAVAASWPSTTTRPPTFALTTRGMNPAAASARVDLPAPVRPATADPLAGRDGDADALDARLAPAGVADVRSSTSSGGPASPRGSPRPSSPDAARGRRARSRRRRPGSAARSQRSIGGSATMR